MKVPAFAPTLPGKRDAGRSNLRLLIQLRWIAIGGQAVTIWVVERWLHIPLPLFPLLVAPALLVLINLASLPLLSRRSAITNAELTAALMLDVIALAWQLHYTGGLDNPFVSLFLLQVVIGAILLKPVTSWAIVAMTFIAVGLLALHSDRLAYPAEYRADPLALYVRGSVVSLALIAVLLVAFVTRMARNLSQRDASLAAARQRAAEEDHIVRMGLLASGAAHELGTPLSTLSVLVVDWQHMESLRDDHALQEDMADMAQAVERCKSIVSGILMSAGEARGIAPQVTTVRKFIEQIVGEWQGVLMPGSLHFHDHMGEDVVIVADAALRQVIGNVIDNAAEASPGRVDITAARREDDLVLEIADAGPGFSEEILENFGKPYRSTKGKPGGGLGLFLLVNVARKLGGDAQADNRPEGGARVELTLPLDSLAYRKAPTA